MKAADLLTFSDSLSVFRDRLPMDVPPWKWLPEIGKALAIALEQAGATHQSIPDGVRVGENVFIDPSVKLPPNAVIDGPAWIGADTEIRPGAYIRGKVIVGRGCVLGNSSEFKNCVLFDGTQAPHFNYVGDSILGEGAHLGAGVILANLRLDQSNVPVKLPGEIVDSGLRKFGAIFGDHAEAGCNAVIQPGTILGRQSVVMPCIPFGGFLPEKKIAYGKMEMRIIDRRF